MILLILAILALAVLYLVGDVSMRLNQNKANKTIIAAGKQRGIK